MAKPSLPQGTRDFSADVVRKRNYIFNTIRNVFELYGFQPLETPAMENLDTLMGKYGDEGDKLIFKILNNGLADKSEKSRTEFEKVLEGKNNAAITERALRYDLTIPFARYVAMNHGQLTMPFKRYQIQPVWRADRPQRGRYREFYQCDADVVGSKSLLNEVELTNIYATVFSKLGIDVEIRINSRKILYALAIAVERLGDYSSGFKTVDDNRKEGLTIISTTVTTAIDKLDKIGIEGVKKELTGKGITERQVDLVLKYLEISGDNIAKISSLENLFSSYINVWAEDETNILPSGLNEIVTILHFFTKTPFKENIVVDFTLARGLNYYTGIIFEIKAKNVQMGSIGGGGRYDDLTGTFGVPNIPGVGISFGVDRIYDVMEELKLFPENVETGTQVLFFNLGEAESKTAFGLMQQLRASNVRCEIYHENAKFDKQFKYADKKGITYAVIIGTKEMEDGTCMLKNLKTGDQTSLPQVQLINQSF
jgi:histidyl-tRNA synthetase